MRVRVVKTRPPFPHGKHIRRMGATLMMWAPFYLGAYLWHRFGPTKSVSYASSEGFHKMEAYAKADAELTLRLFQVGPPNHVDPWGNMWTWSFTENRWMCIGYVGSVS